MRYLKLFENHISKVEVAKICRSYYIMNWTLNSNGTVDVDDNVYLSGIELTELPLNFGRISGSFMCRSNDLTSLEGVPQYVGRDFSCNRNNLTSLEGCPKYVGRDFYCQTNNIRSFEGIDYIGGVFWCSSNPISVLWSLFQDKSKIELFNEWEVIQNDQVILYRLNDFLAEIGKEDVTEDQLNDIKKHYTVL